MWLGKANGVEGRLGPVIQHKKMLLSLFGYRSGLDSTLGSLAMRDYVDALTRQRSSAYRQLYSSLIAGGTHGGEAMAAIAGGEIKIRWTAEKFLGHPPTRSESAILSDALAKLEKYGLVTLIDGTRGEGKKSRARFIRLTSSGVERCKSFYEGVIDDDLAELSAYETKRHLMSLGIYEDEESSSLTD